MILIVKKKINHSNLERPEKVDLKIHFILIYLLNYIINIILQLHNKMEQ